MDDKLEKEQQKLDTKKLKLQAEESKLKEKMRKMRTRRLIELGGLIAKVNLDSLPTNTLYGLLIEAKNTLENNTNSKDEWTKIGDEAFTKEQNAKTLITLKFEQKPTKEIRDFIRNLSLKFNRLDHHWYGNIKDISSLEKYLNTLKVKYELETSKNPK